MGKVHAIGLRRFKARQEQIATALLAAYRSFREKSFAMLAAKLRDMPAVNSEEFFVFGVDVGGSSSFSAAKLNANEFARSIGK